jgi:hypothetical protein
MAKSKINWLDSLPVFNDPIFVGRQKELCLLDDIVNQKHLAVVLGNFGIGKKRLIRQYCENHYKHFFLIISIDKDNLLQTTRLAEKKLDFPKEIKWKSENQQVWWNEFWVAIINQNSIINKMKTAVSQLFRTPQKPSLIILNNVNTLEEFEKLKQKLKLNNLNCRFIITAKKLSNWSKHSCIQLNAFTSEEVIKFFFRNKFDHRSTNAKNQIISLAKLVNNHPLALHMLKIYLQESKTPVLTLIHQLKIVSNDKRRWIEFFEKIHKVCAKGSQSYNLLDLNAHELSKAIYRPLISLDSFREQLFSTSLNPDVSIKAAPTAAQKSPKLK